MTERSEAPDRAAIYRAHAEEVAIPNLEPPPDEKLRRLLTDDDQSAASIELEAERRRSELEMLERRCAEKATQEAEEAARAAELKRQQDATDAELTVRLDAVRQRVLQSFPGLEDAIVEIERALAEHRQRADQLGIAPAVADRVLWAHPVSRLTPWLDLFRTDGLFPGNQWQRQG